MRESVYNVYMSDIENLSESISTRLTKMERDWIENEAEKREWSVSQYIRKLVTKEIKRVAKRQH